MNSFFGKSFFDRFFSILKGGGHYKGKESVKQSCYMHRQSLGLQQRLISQKYVRNPKHY